MALVLALPLVTSRVPLGEGLQALVGSRQVQPTAFQLPALTTAPAASRRLAVPVVAGEGPYRITPERRALLNTIRFAEGTWTAGSPVGYRMLYGGGQVEVSVPLLTPEIISDYNRKESARQKKI